MYAYCSDTIVQAISRLADPDGTRGGFLHRAVEDDGGSRPEGTLPELGAGIRLVAPEPPFDDGGVYHRLQGAHQDQHPELPSVSPYGPIAVELHALGPLVGPAQ